MLSRVADSLYWMARYMERAEDITRILTVNFNALLDLPPHDVEQSWRSLIEITGDAPLYAQRFEGYTARNTMTFLLWDEGNPNSVFSCINLARENARTVREQISSEMWEQINRLYFHLRNVNRSAVLRGPADLFATVRDGSHAFQGVTHATMTHGDGYHFIQLGKHLERSEKTARILDVKYAALGGLEEGSPVQTIQLSAMLRSCSAMESYRKTAQTLQTTRVVEFMLLNREFPRTVYFCMNSVLDALKHISESTENLATRTAGRIVSDLAYLDLAEVLGDGLHEYLERTLQRMNALGDDITRTFFSAQVILPGWRSYMQQVQQQQQQQTKKKGDSRSRGE
ncbi:MAG: alpha-E domain-containing protein [Chloroflexi bacterium]|nr:alpha-E domain-containing protein [Chloroflexota bacterium]